MCHAHARWSQILSTVLLGLRTSVMACGSSAAEYLYGINLRIPGEFVLPDNLVHNPLTFVSEFRDHMREIKPVLTSDHDRRIFTSQDLSTCLRVFFRIGRSRRSLERPYSGLHKIAKRLSHRVYEINVVGTHKQVSVENLKPAYIARSTTEIDNQSISTSIPIQINIPHRETPIKAPMPSINNLDSEIPTKTRSDQPLEINQQSADQSAHDSAQSSCSNSTPTITAHSESKSDLSATNNCLLDHDYASII